MSIATLIAPLMATRCFVSYRLEWNPDAGKYDKIPIDPRTQRNCNPFELETCVTGAEILASGLPVALVLSEALQVFCIDLDSVRLPDGNWTPETHTICSWFPGAAFELSVSGRGLHILGRAQLERHRVSQDENPWIQVYSRKRFIALTGAEFSGSLDTWHTDAVVRVINAYLPEPIQPETPDVWTYGPYESFRGGITDDARLIEALLHARGGARATFGEGATFRDLWECNSERLAIAYPAESAGKAWNYSGADQALANMLAHATGCDCERILRLMQYSGLRRDKWQYHRTYLRDTILRAVRGKIPAVAPSLHQGPAETRNAECYPQLTETALPQPMAPQPLVSNAQLATVTTDDTAVPPLAYDSALEIRKSWPPGSYISEADQHVIFNGWTYLRDRHALIGPDAKIRSPSEFDVMFGGYEWQMTVDGLKPGKSAWECFSQSQLIKFPQAEGMRFEPTLPPLSRVEHHGFWYINSYMPLNIRRVAGDPSIFLEHMDKLFPYGDDKLIYLSFMAFCVQFKGRKADWTPLVQGCEGNGKTFLSRTLEYCLGEPYVYFPTPNNFHNHFNAHLYGKLLICLEDLQISEAKGSVWETLKPMITQDRQEITFKGRDGSMREVCYNFTLNCNPRNSVKMTRNTRRIAPFYCPQQYAPDLERCGMGEKYMQRLFGWAKDDNMYGWAVVFDYLSTFQIPERFHPGIGAHRAPKTTSVETAIKYGRGYIEQEVLNAIETGKPGFCGGFVSSHCLDQLLIELGHARRISRTMREDIMSDLGYRLHNDLMGGRCSEPLPDNTQPYLYVPVEGHPSEGHGWQRGRVEKAYWDAQLARR